MWLVLICFVGGDSIGGNCAVECAISPDLVFALWAEGPRPLPRFSLLNTLLRGCYTHLHPCPASSQPPPSLYLHALFAHWTDAIAIHARARPTCWMVFLGGEGQSKSLRGDLCWSQHWLHLNGDKFPGYNAYTFLITVPQNDVKTTHETDLA